MKRLLSLLILLSFLTVAYSQEFYAQPPESTLPSQKTEQDFSTLPTETSNPSLRARPSGEAGDGNAQKVPLGNTSWMMALATLLMYAGYQLLIKKTANMRINKLLLKERKKAVLNKHYRLFKSTGLLLLLFFPMAVFALPPMAKNANYFNVPREGTAMQRFYNVPVLNNATFDCLTANITINAVTQPQHGTITSWNFATGGSVVVRYQANTTSGYIMDSFQYTITCNGETSAVATAYLHHGNAPDNISTDVCAIPAVPFTWQFGTKARSGNIKANTVDTWLAGDLDKNGTSEIVVTGGRGAIGPTFDSLLVFRDGNLADVSIFNLKELAGITSTFYRYSMYSARHLISRFSNEKGAYVVLNSDGYIYAYEYDTSGSAPTLTWRYKSDRQWVNTNTAGTNTHYPFEYTANNMGVTDFDGDGINEIYIGNKVFSLDGLNYLTGLPDTDYADWRYDNPNYNNCGYSIQSSSQDRLSNTPQTTLFNADYGLLTMSVAIDLDHDGLPELVCGGKAYKITNNAGTWSISLYKSAPEVSTGKITDIGIVPIRNDGRTSIADFNGDGYPDIFVDYVSYHTNTAVANMYWACYAWDVHNNTILFADTIQAQVTSVPLLADIDGDGQLEIAHTKLTGLSIPNHTPPYNVKAQDSHIRGYKIPSTWGTSSRLTRKWWESVNENATRTGMTAFDFNNDGKMEIVYRDMENLRIMNAKPDGTIENLIITPAGSSTTNEMPIVVDIDNDGASEILCVGSPTYNSNVGEMFIYASGSASPWAPSRNVWNQYAYNPVLVNEDLTIPIHAFNPSAKFIQEDGTVKQPFNSFYQQTSKLNPYGETLNLGPNLLFNPTAKPKMNYNPANDKMNIQLNVLNAGDIAFDGPITIALYAYTSATSEYKRLGNQETIGTSTSSLAVNSSISYSYDVNNFMTLLPANFNSFYLFINSVHNGTSAPTYYAGSIECNEADNFTGRLSFTSLERVICEGNTETLKLPESFSYKWYTTSTGGTPLTTVAGHDNWLSLTKNADERTLLFVENYQLGNLTGSPVSPFRDTLFIYRTPDTLIWTGAYNSDWHYHKNWSKPSGVIDNYSEANIPRSCTNVLIPDAITSYPDLTAVSSGTNYVIYSNALCNRITINHGGEIKQPDSLHYDRAHIDITLNSNRWYMWSPPLKDLYPGDIYVHDKNPWLDDAFVFTKLFSKANPQNNYLAADWTGNFITPVIPITAGDGMRVWVDDKQDDSSIRTPFTFDFPKWDTQHHIYGADNQGIWATYNVPSRSNNGRFIFDGMPNATTKNFAISTPGVSGTGVKANELWLVGNPFMAHIDFAEFYAANSSKIKNQFRIMTANGSYEYYNSGAGTLNQYIAPMQSFIVEAQSSFTNLTLNGNMTVNRTGSDRKLRSTAKELESAPVLSISLADPTDLRNILSRIFIIATDDVSNGIDNNDLRLMANIYTTVAEEPTVLFSKSIEESPSLLSVNYLDANNIDNLDIPLGLRSVKSGQRLCLLVQGQTYFANGKELNLYDKLENKRYNLRGTTWFYFDNHTDIEQLDNRFVIEIGLRNANSIEDVVKPAEKTIIDKAFYDLTGRPVSKSAAKGILIQKSIYEDGSIGYKKVYIK